MQRETGVIINIEEKDNRGEVTISSPNNNSIQAALKRINDIIAIPEEGQTYEGPVKTITDFGSFTLSYARQRWLVTHLRNIVGTFRYHGRHI